MHTNVHCSTVYNSKDLESTQMPMDDRLDRENVAHIHHGLLFSKQKCWVPLQGHGWTWRTSFSANWHKTENEIPHVLTHRRVMNNENTWTQGGEHYRLGSVGGNSGGTVGVGCWGEIAWGEMPDISEGRKAAHHIATCVPMQLSCMFFTCTWKPKMQEKNKNK